MTVCYLRFGAEYLEDAERYASIARAVKAYRRYAKAALSHGSTPDDASIHIAAAHEELQEYPDWMLSVGPRGGLLKERC